MKKTAFLFPGQGSQAIGMGQDLYEEFDAVKALFETAEQITKIPLAKLCFEGPMEELTQTINLQPAVTAVNLAILTALEEGGARKDVTAGHSLGEYSALCASGIIPLEDTFALVLQRGTLMHEESMKNKGAMHALIGLTVDIVEDIVAEAQKDGIVAIANHNAEEQIAIAGSPDAVEKASSLAVQKGARAVPLKVSGAWHSELVRGAERPFKEHLAGTAFNPPETPIVLNVTAETGRDPDEIREVMGRQLCSPVKWYDTMQRLMQEEVEVFVEVGPGRVLTGLLRKTLPKDYPGKVLNVNNMKGLDAFAEAAS